MARRVPAGRGRSLASEACPYLWLDATYVKVREAGRVTSIAALVTTGVAATGERRVLGLELSVGEREVHQEIGLGPGGIRKDGH